MDSLAYYERFVGKLLDDRYRVEKVLGIGGMAVVFKATDTQDGKTVAIKLLKDEIAGDREARKRFVNESRAVSMLSHPNIVGIYSVSTGGKYKYLVMEYIEGISLRSYMDKKGSALSFDEVLTYSEQILAALNHAHSKGIVHRDIKPQNIMLLKNGIVKVTDFGIAKLPGAEDEPMDENNKAVGTVYYVSPEQADAGYSDERSDLYSLGILMYEMATGQLPFEGDSPITVLLKQINDPPTPPRKINKKIPRGLQTLILSAMEKNPNKRYQSALDMFRELRKLRWSKHAAVLTPVKVKKDKRSRKNREQNPASRATTPVILGIAFAILFVAIVALFVGLDRLEIGGINRASISVPEVQGLSYTSLEDCGGDKEAYEKALEELGLDKNFTVTVEYEYSDNSARGTIIKQSPAPGASRKSPAKVVLTVSLGTEMVAIGDYTIIDWRLARSNLRAEGFIVNIQKEENIAIKAGAVIGTVPEPGTVVKRGSEITLRVSLGTEAQLVALPDFFGKKEPEVITVLNALSVDVGNVVYTRSSLPAGSIIAQNPEAGANVYFGADTVDFTVSGGPDFNTNVYPDVMGLTREEAESKLYIFGIDDIAIIKVKSESDENTVVKQSPYVADYGKTTRSATLQISGGPEYSNVVRIPNVVGETADDAKLLLDFCFGDGAAIVYNVKLKRMDEPAGKVVTQSPAAGDKVDTAVGRITVTLLVSGGPDYTVTLSVPNVDGMYGEELEYELENAGFTPVYVTVRSDKAVGTVTGYQYHADEEVTGPEGAVPFEIYVSGGPDYVETTAPEETTAAPEESGSEDTAASPDEPAETTKPE